MDQWTLPNLDESLREAILAALAAESREVFSNIRVGVLNSVVHLAGTVGTLEERSAAESIARSMPGVRGVVNRIESPGAPCPARTINLDLE